MQEPICEEWHSNQYHQHTNPPPQPTSITNFMLKVLFIGDNIFTRNLSRNIKLNIEDHVQVGVLLGRCVCVCEWWTFGVGTRAKKTFVCLCLLRLQLRTTTLFTFFITTIVIIVITAITNIIKCESSNVTFESKAGTRLAGWSFISWK